MILCLVDVINCVFAGLHYYSLNKSRFLPEFILVKTGAGMTRCSDSQ